MSTKFSMPDTDKAFGNQDGQMLAFGIVVGKPSGGHSDQIHAEMEW